MMACVATATDYRQKIALREGYYNEDEDIGFGRRKTDEKHNLWEQPILATIALSITISPEENNRKEYIKVFHQTDGVEDQQVLVVFDMTKNFDGESTHDGHYLGVLTGYCLTPGGKSEPRCPQWVNLTL